MSDCNDCTNCPHASSDLVEVIIHDKPDSGLYIVETKMKPGAILQSHTHTHEHVSILVQGEVIVEINEKALWHEGYQQLTIPAGAAHQVEALTDAIWLCMWSKDKAPEEQMQEFINGQLGSMG